MDASPRDASVQRVVSGDGTGIAVWSSGSGPPLVLVHGTTADHTRWSRVVPGFGVHFTVYALDRRGRGGSEDADAYAIEREAEDVAAVVDAVADGSGRVNLLGHSYGAICCIEAALLTTNLHKLVLYEPPIPVGPPLVSAATRERIEAHLAGNEREAALLTFFRDVVRMSEKELAVLRAHPAWPSRVAAAHTLARETRIESGYHLDQARLNRLETPALLLLGSNSPAPFHEATRLLDAALPASRILELPGQQHVAMDLVPQEFVDLVSAFLR